LQYFIALTILFSGLCKSYFPIPKLVLLGQTKIQNLPIPLVRFIGISEILGAVGIILPWYLQIWPLLTPVTAICFALIMVLAAPIHYQQQEYKIVLLNTVLFFICVFIAYHRFCNFN